MGQEDWLRLQRKIFSRWVNQKLWMSRKIKVNDIIEDVKNDPTVLLALTEVLSEKTFKGKLDKNMKLRVVKLDNIVRILKFLYDDCKIQMKMKVSPENCVDGEEKSMLGLIFAIMNKFMKIGDDEDAEKLSAKDALLMWVQNKTQGYRNVNVTNYTTSFHNGLALAAIIHKHRPQMIDFDSLDPTQKETNLKKVMDAAERYFGLEQYLTPAEVLKLDENSCVSVFALGGLGMVVYISEYFYGIAEQRKLDQAARRIHKLIVFTKTCDAMRADYGDQSSKFKARLVSVEKVLEDRSIDNTMAGAKKKIEEFYEYKAKDKAVLIGYQLNLEGLFNNLAMLLANNNRPEFVPPAGLSLKDVEGAMLHLEAVEAERKVALHQELNRQVRLLEVDGHHKLLFGKLQAWQEQKKQYLSHQVIVESVGAAQFSLRTLDAFDKEKEAVECSSVGQLYALGAELQSENYENAVAVQEREQEVRNGLINLADLSKEKRPVLEDDLARETFKEDVRMKARQHADKHEKLLSWVVEKEAFLAQRDELVSVTECQLQLKLLEVCNAEQTEVLSTSVAGLKALGTEILNASYSTAYNDYVYEASDEIQARHDGIDHKFEGLTESSSSKKQYLDDCLVREQKKEELRLEFAHQAGEYTRWTKDQAENAELATFGFNLEEVEAYGVELQQSETALGSERDAKISGYEATWNSLQELSVVENPYTTLTTEDLSGSSTILSNAIEHRRQMYEAELARQRANDALCKEFADLADPLSRWISEQKEFITASKAALRDQLGHVEGKLNNLASDGSSLKPIRDLQQRIDDAGITNNRHTTQTAKDMDVQWEQWEAFLRKKKEMLEREIEAEERRGISAEQFREIEENFQQFDRNKSGSIDLKELKACLYSLGEELTLTQVKAIMDEYGDGGKMLYDNFKKYMIHLFGDTDTKEEILNGFNLICRGEPVAKLDKLELVLQPEDLTYFTSNAPAADGGHNFNAWTEDVFSR